MSRKRSLTATRCKGSGGGKKQENRSLGRDVKEALAQHQQILDIQGDLGGDGNEAVFAELGRPDKKAGLARCVVFTLQPDGFRDP